MTPEAKDRYLIFVPDGQSLPRLAWNADGVRRAMDELGRYAQVDRVTPGELVRENIGSHFLPSEPDEYEDDDIALRRHHFAQRASGAFGRR